MKKLHKIYWYILFFAGMMLIDRITKTLMLWWGDTEIQLTSFLSLKLCFNRGVSWGMLHSHSTIQFLFVIGLTLTVTSVLGLYTYRQWKEGHTIWCETLALSGAVSNLFDRFFHNGVIDFVSFCAGNMFFPSFNFADACIVAGVFCMILTLFLDKPETGATS